MGNGNKKKILIIDDDDEIRGIYVDIFNQKGWQVLEAKDGIEGMDIATSEEDIDAIFTGIIMPRLDGFQMMKSLKERTSTSGIPVFISSHLGREQDRQKAKELGAVDFIVQGRVSPSEAFQRITYQLSGKSYLLKVDPYELNAQEVIADLELPEELKCKNCGTSLAIKITPAEEDFKAKFICPSCEKEY